MSQHDAIQGQDNANLQKACWNCAYSTLSWNWALTGFTDVGVYPQNILDYLRMPGQIEDLRRQGFDVPDHFDADAWILDNINVDQGRQWFQDNKNVIDAIWREYETDIAKWYRSGDTVNFKTVSKLVRQLIAANGFVISEKSPYQICMHYKKADGVTFDHWWIKVDDTVIETFPGRILADGSVRGVRDIQRNHILDALNAM